MADLVLVKDNRSQDKKRPTQRQVDPSRGGFTVAATNQHAALWTPDPFPASFLAPSRHGLETWEAVGSRSKYDPFGSLAEDVIFHAP